MQMSGAPRILVTGITSIHGWPVFQKLRALLPQDTFFGIKPPASQVPGGRNVSPVCMTDRKTLQSIKEAFKPTHVIHCAGVCDLDVCEDRPGWAYAINVEGAKNMADVFGHDTPMIYLSTDLVFSGNNPPDGGYAETDEPDPISVAGKTFAEAEEYVRRCPHHCIVRLGLPLGDSVNGEKGPIDWIESRFRRNLPVTLFFDELRSCISCQAIGEMSVSVLDAQATGLFHFGGEKSWSLYDIGAYVIRKGNYPKALLKGIMRHEEKHGPPRIGDVSLNSGKMKHLYFPEREKPEPA